MTDVESISQTSDFDIKIIMSDDDGKMSPFLTINTDFSYLAPRPPSTISSISITHIPSNISSNMSSNKSTPRDFYRSPIMMQNPMNDKSPIMMLNPMSNKSPIMIQNPTDDNETISDNTSYYSSEDIDEDANENEKTVLYNNPIIDVKCITTTDCIDHFSLEPEPVCEPELPKENMKKKKKNKKKKWSTISVVVVGGLCLLFLL